MATAAADPAVDVAALLRAAVERLRASRSPSPRLDAEVLLAHAVGRDRSWVLAHPEARPDAASRHRFAEWIERRAAGEPIAYIRGFKEWLGLRIHVDARVLIPRPETELLAECAIDEASRRLATASPARPLVAWDVGTGSAALLVALGSALRDAVRDGAVRLIGSDMSAGALEVARANLEEHGVGGATLLELDLLGEPGTGLPTPDIVVANLPYVPSAEIPTLPVAASFEPRAALDGGADGLGVVRRLLGQLATGLAPGGVALLEIGAGQAQAVIRAASEYRTLASVAGRDLAGVERVVAVRPAHA